MADFKSGDFVRIIGQDTIGEVISVKGNNLEVAVGLLKLNVKKSNVEPAEAPEDEYEEDDYAAEDAGIDTKEKLMNFKFELDVRGKMKDEVMVELESWVDDAVLLGINEAKVVHGRGNGVLKDTVRAYLRKYKEVESMKDEEPGKGGEGVTLVKFKV